MDLEVELPGEESFVRMARLVVGGFATASVEIDDVRLGGLRMAVTEACQTALQARAEVRRGARLRVRARLEDERLHVWVEDPMGGIASEDLLLAELLVNELEVDQALDGRSVAHLVVDAGPSGPTDER